MPHEPPVKRAVAFVDGQNLFYSAKVAFGHRYPNFDVLKLARKVCDGRLWMLTEARFYSRNTRGIDKTDWIPIDRATYDECLDARDYRPKAKP